MGKKGTKSPEKNRDIKYPRLFVPTTFKINLKNEIKVNLIKGSDKYTQN